MKTSEEFIYDSARRGPVALEELRGIFRYRDLILQLIRKDIVARYKRSVLGVAWTMLQPLGMMIILSVVFSTLFSQVKGYPAYILSGLIAWTFFSQATSAMMTQIVWGGALLRQIYLPRTSFAVSSIGTGLTNLGISFIPLVFIVLIIGLPIRWSILFVPISMLLLGAFALGVGLIVSTMSIYFPDVSDMYSLVLTGWMYLTPIVYPETLIPEAYRYWFFHLNPMYYYVKIFRAPIFEGVIPDGSTLLVAALISTVTLAIGWLFFSKRSDEFAYHL
ncbi:MAG TPA: ABC transporter permease [Anaerolineales bacterium]|nr:ABC transporter permease [Anaerolineales bacterium]HMV95855.1 ABC transporter permease [Anaerolineales bacterium]HMX18672.1 ABC transporter permease [Anaerolineales bacterium]HMX75157.1 ABC transporter permease [Anaerolineales bacterium]HMZ43644.1 ABC transporter permease [Anaerolineales bacterium]